MQSIRNRAVGMRRGCRGNTLHKTYRLPPCSGGGSPRILARRKRGLTGSAISFRFRRSRRNGENGGCQCGGFRRRVEIFSAGKNTTRHLSAHKPQRTQYASLFSVKKKNLPLALPVGFALSKKRPLGRS